VNGHANKKRKLEETQIANENDLNNAKRLKPNGYNPE
jgi:hypothetical protein